jgi:hypothetical protein
MCHLLLQRFELAVLERYAFLLGGKDILGQLREKDVLERAGDHLNLQQRSNVG